MCQLPYHVEFLLKSSGKWTDYRENVGKVLKMRFVFLFVVLQAFVSSTIICNLVLCLFCLFECVSAIFLNEIDIC